MGRIERPPGWILKYKDRIENEEITVEEILDEENSVREAPIKISSVTRAINAMGLPITGLRSGGKGDVPEGADEGSRETSGSSERIVRGPGWLQKYREKMEKGEITVDEILEEENKIRQEPIKIATVKRAVNAMGYPITGMQNEQEDAAIEGGAKSLNTEGERATGAEKGPGWLQKYRERIEKGEITVDEILEEENALRKVPIKRSSVTRAVNAMGYPITGIQSEDAAIEGGAKSLNTEGERATGAEKGPGWLQKYRERVEKGEITVDEILEEENALRKMPIKRSSVTRAVNAMGYPITGMREEREAAAGEGETPKKAGKGEAMAYSSSIGKLSESTAKRFTEIKKHWEEELDKSLENDYFINLLLALAKLTEQGKSLEPVKK